MHILDGGEPASEEPNWKKRLINGLTSAISAANYWHLHVLIDQNGKRRGLVAYLHELVHEEGVFTHPVCFLLLSSFHWVVVGGRSPWHPELRLHCHLSLRERSGRQLIVAHALLCQPKLSLQLPATSVHLITSASFKAETSVRSPRKLFMFLI